MVLWKRIEPTVSKFFALVVTLVVFLVAMTFVGGVVYAGLRLTSILENPQSDSIRLNVMDEEDEVLVETTLLLSLDVGKFPPDRNAPEDYGEYLYQSDHQIHECKILQVVQDRTDSEREITELKQMLSYAYAKMGNQPVTPSRDFYDEEMMGKISKALKSKGK